MYWSSVMPGGNVVTNWKTKRSNTIRNAKAITGINEYCMNALNHDQNRKWSFGTMKNGTKIGPTRAHKALAMSPNATTASDTTFASVTISSKIRRIEAKGKKSRRDWWDTHAGGTGSHPLSRDGIEFA